MALAARRNGDEMGVAAVDRAVRTGSRSLCSGRGGVAGADGVACVWSGCAIVHDFLGGQGSVAPVGVLASRRHDLLACGWGVDGR